MMCPYISRIASCLNQSRIFFLVFAIMIVLILRLKQLDEMILERNEVTILSRIKCPGRKKSCQPMDLEVMQLSHNRTNGVIPNRGRETN